MRYYITIIFLIFCLVTNIYSQNLISFSTDIQYQDTLHLCSDQQVTYRAFVVNQQGDTLTGYNIFWDFDNGDNDNQIDLNSYIYQYLVGGFYRLMIIATKANDTLLFIKPIKVAIKPNFVGTKANLPSNQDGICDGDEIQLLSNVSSIKWIEKRKSVYSDAFPVYFDHNYVYSTSINRKNFSQSQKILTISDIDSIGITIEHSNSSTIKIAIECPNGQNTVLKDFGGEQLYLGEPIVLSNNYNPGVGYWYWFKANSTIGTMNSIVGGQTIPSGVYTSQNSFASLIGCPLNGKWSIKVYDNSNDNHDGFVWSWAIYFNKNIETDTIEFENNYNVTQSVWSGEGINYTDNGTGYARPSGKGSHTYDYLIKDDFGCWHDTSILILVEKPKIEIEKTNMYCGDSTKFEDKTSWSKVWSWSFDDNSPLFNEKEGYKKYSDTGTYKIILTATSQSGCKDRDTVKIVIIPKPIEIVAYNIFTPNEDGKNDVFNFFNTPDEKIIAENIADINGSVFDRNGNVVCRWNTPEEIKKGWDGSYFNNGVRNLPTGFYYYVLKIKGKDGISYKPFSGTIYLYREVK